MKVILFVVLKHKCAMADEEITRQVYFLFQDLWNESLGFFPEGFNAKNGAKMCSKDV